MSEIIREQYVVLEDLRRCDEKLVRLKRELDLIPVETEKLKRHLEQESLLLKDERTLFEGTEKRLRKLEQDLKEKEDGLSKAQDKMMGVKTNVEYQAALKENEQRKGEKSGLEDLVLALLSEVEVHRSKVKECESQFMSLESVANGDIKRLEGERTKLLDLFSKQNQTKENTLVRLSSDVRSMYQRVAARIVGVPVVPAENGMCSGCNMMIRPQLFNEVIGFQAIHRCPSCGRILICHPSTTTEHDSEPSS